VISLVSEYHHHPAMMHLSAHQDISLGQKIVHLHHLEKHLMGQVVYTFLGKKNTNHFVAIKSDFVFSSIVWQFPSKDEEQHTFRTTPQEHW